MNFVPVNNYLYVRTVEDDETEDVGILLPQDYRSVESPFAVVELLQTHTTLTNVMWGAESFVWLWRLICCEILSITVRLIRLSKSSMS
jgi:hypothetical protein